MAWPGPASGLGAGSVLASSNAPQLPSPGPHASIPALSSFLPCQPRRAWLSLAAVVSLVAQLPSDPLPAPHLPVDQATASTFPAAGGSSETLESRGHPSLCAQHPGEQLAEALHTAPLLNDG